MFFLRLHARSCDAYISQAAREICAGQGAFLEILERIEGFFRRLEIYAEVPVGGRIF